MLANILVSGFFFSLDVFLLALAGLIRLSPSILKTARIFLRYFMDLSSRFYQLILGEAAPYLQSHWGLDILAGALRVLSSVLLSLILGLLLLWIFGFSITVLSIILCILHGLVVGLVWSNVAPPVDGFRTGMNVE